MVAECAGRAGRLVVIRSNVRQKGVKIVDMNRVLAAYDKDVPATTKAPVDGTYESTSTLRELSTLIYFVSKSFTGQQ